MKNEIDEIKAAVRDELIDEETAEAALEELQTRLDEARAWLSMTPEERAIEAEADRIITEERAKCADLP
jgi:hypothetical protein